MVQIITSKAASNYLAKQIDERVKNPTYIWGIPYGFGQLDRKTGGIQKGEMTILIARPGVGKSAFAGKVALNVAEWLRQQGSEKVVRIVSIEQDFATWQQRLACYLSNVPITLITSGFATDKQVKEYKAALNTIAEYPIECIDQEVSLTTIEQFIRYQDRCAFWVLDHIGIIPQVDPRNQASSLASISNVLRNLSRDTAPSLVLSQMNRKAEERQDKRPTPSDVYGSDYIVQNARRIFGLYREDVYLKLSEEDRRKPQPGELLILKANNGSVGAIDMVYNPQRLDWYEVE